MKANQNVTVLYVDDDGGNRRLLSDAFAEGATDVNLVGLESCDDLLGYLRDASLPEHTLFPDVILLDLDVLPRGGRNALAEIKADARYRHVPVVVFSASPAPDDVTLSYRLGANSFLRKPDSFQMMVELVRVFSDYWFDVCELPSRKLN